MFSLEQALAQNSRIMSERRAKLGRKLSYVLYYTNSTIAEGKILGYTCKELRREFKETKGTYKFAAIYKLGTNQLISTYNSAVNKNFISHTRTGKKKVK